MKLRTSFFDKTVFFKNVTRFAPAWGLYALGLLMALMTMASSDLEYWQVDALGESIQLMPLINLGYALVCAMLLFGDLFNTRMCNALHALPLRREGWFATHVLAGLLFSLIPNAAVAVINLLFLWPDLFISPLWLLGVEVQFLFFFALSAVCIMLTGSRFAASAVYLLMNFLSMIGYWFVTTYYEPLLPGLHIRDNLFSLFCPAVWLCDHELITFKEVEHYTQSIYGEELYFTYKFESFTSAWWYIAVLAALGLALLALSLWLYRKRKLESAGDFLSFPKTAPVFLVVFTLTIGAMFQTIFGLMGGSVISMLVGLAVGCYAGQMLLRRTVKVFDKRSLIWCGSIVGVLALTLGITALDPAGLTSWTPQPDQVKAVVLSSDYDYSPKDAELYGYSNSVTITDPGYIQELIHIHGLMIEDEAAGMMDTAFLWSSEVSSVHLTYQLKNGSQVERRYYYLVASEAGRRMEEFYSAPEFVLGYSDWNDYLDSIDYIELDNCNGGFLELTNAQSLALMEAVKADCEAGTFPSDKETEYVWITIYDNEGNYNNSFPVSLGCGNACDWLTQNVPELFE